MEMRPAVLDSPEGDSPTAPGAMSLVWQTPPGETTDFEQQFLRDVIFSQTPHQAVFDEGACQAPASDAVIIHSSFARRPPQALLDYLANAPGHCLLHAGDERLQSDPANYGSARAVLRSYFNPRLPAERIFTLPLGFQSGFLNTADVDFNAKDVIWCFAGQLKSHRKRMIEAFSAFTPNTVHLTSQWSDPKAMSVEKVALLYSRTVFVPCPFGYRNPETYRVMEALEHGCIPVVLTFLGDDYFRYVYGDHPFIVAKTWAKAAAQVQAVLADPASLRERQRATARWYADFKRDLALDVRDILQGARHEDLRSRQFFYQKQGMSRRGRRLYSLYFGRGPIRRVFRWAAFAGS
jgi:hypothetical protein